MADYQPVQKALSEGLNPAMLCQTCPWDRPCISPPSMTKADVDAQINKAMKEDEARMEEQKALGRDPGMPLGGLMMAVTLGGKDTSAQICPVFALRLRSSAGRGIADRLRESMQGWDDES